ncbi:MAG: DHHA1 domain-containing protein [Planctomycetota bacterium]|nr:DHHA1 domain-containing protein [Planctomycetota bacterium]
MPSGAASLAAVGVAFKLAWAICEEIAGRPKVGDERQRLLISFLPLVAVGTIADVAPLQGENRILVAHGLQALRHGPPGLLALWQTSGLDPARAAASEVAFIVAPRLNAAGRVRHASLALELLLADDEAAAQPLAAELSRLNSERQAQCDQVAAEAVAWVAAAGDEAESGAIVASGDGWHEGVIGIVASRLVETFGKPAAVIAFAPGGEIGKGSARSIPGVNLYEALAHCAAQGCLLAFGGHEQAAGFKIARDRLAFFRQAFAAWCRQEIYRKGLAAEMMIDLEVTIPEIGEALACDLERLAPFGSGNPAPRFLARGVQIAGQPQTFGRQEEHFRFCASQAGAAAIAKAFRGQEWLRAIDNGVREWDIVFQIARNQFLSPPAVELHIKDMKPAGFGVSIR